MHLYVIAFAATGIIALILSVFVLFKNHKNPITVIQTFSEYLPAKYEDPEFRGKFQKIISSETRRISQIVNDLLAFAKPAEPRKESCLLIDVMRNVAELLTADRLAFTAGKASALHFLFVFL